MLELRPYQKEAKAAIDREWDMGRQRTLMVLPTGCHACGEKLLMSDGRTKPVDEIRVGEHLMGPDGTPRTVLYRQFGNADMYEIAPLKGKSFLVTGDHMLTLVKTNISNKKDYPSCKGGTIEDVTVNDWLTWSDSKKHIYKLLRCSGIAEFERKTSQLPIDPYFLGILLGDGSLKYQTSVTTAEPEVAEMLDTEAERYGMSIRTKRAGKATTYFFRRNTARLNQQLQFLGLRGHTAKDKFVPDAYKYAPIRQRLELLAGLMDSDGFYDRGDYDYITKSEQLAQDIVFLCRSVGLSAYSKKCTKGYGNSFRAEYHRINISGHCEVIPCRVSRRKAVARQRKKNVLRTGFTCTYVGKRDYVGFTVDGDNRYLLDDFTITHNCGKTIVFSATASDKVRSGGNVLILAGRDELLTQAADKLYKTTGLTSVFEKAEQHSIGSDARVTIASVQTLCQERRLNQFGPEYFSHLIIDEAHHVISDSYGRVLQHFPDAYVLGCTATPDRGDKKNLGKVFDSLAYEYTMRQAVNDGYLVPIKVKMLPLTLDISNVKVSAGDFAVNELGSSIEPYLDEIAREMSETCMDRKTIVFLPLVRTSQKFCDVLNSYGFKAVEVNGDTPNRDEILKAYEDGEYNVICNSMLLTEGWDSPQTDCVVVLRPTKVRGLYTQMIGRGTRIHPGKENLLVLDFLWLTDRHDLCKPSSLLCKNEEVAHHMDKMLYEDGEIDILEAEETAERDVVAEREEALRRELEDMRGRKLKLVDPLQYAFSIAEEDLANYVPSFGWEMMPPSDKQLKMLESRGISASGIECAGKASLIIDRLIARQKAGLTTPKQIRFLENRGFQHVGTWSFTDASNMISRISGNNWMIPYGVVPSRYTP